MKQRSPVAVILLPFVTFGIYSIYWLVSTKIEMTKLGAKIPTAWLIIVPLANIWWYWKYSEGVDSITNNKISNVIAFILLLLLGFIGQAIIQDSFNNVSASTVANGSENPVSPVAPVTANTTEDQDTTPQNPTNTPSI
jgi:hypothetical protein